MPWISVGRGHVLVSVRPASELKALPISSRPLLTTNRGLGFWYPPCRMTGIRLFAFAKRLAHLVPVWPDYFSTRRRDSCFLMRAVDARSSATHICGTATSVLFARYPPPFPAIRLSMQTACRPMCVCVCVCAYPRARARTVDGRSLGELRTPGAIPTMIREQPLFSHHWPVVEL